MTVFNYVVEHIFWVPVHQIFEGSFIGIYTVKFVLDTDAQVTFEVNLQETFRHFNNVFKLLIDDCYQVEYLFLCLAYIFVQYLILMLFLARVNERDV